MPELPEVETIKNDLQRLIVGKKILEITTDTPKMVKPSLARVKEAVIGKTIKGFDRKAKLLVIKLSDGVILTAHLKMTGRLLIRKKGTKKDDWQHITMTLSGDKELRFADLRKFGWVRLADQEELERMLKELGPEPKDMSLKEFTTYVKSTKRNIKVHLMDQEKLAGLGNIYVVDTLNLAKISPKRTADSLNNEEIKRLHQACQKVLQAGIKYRGASDNYYLDALGRKGKYQDHFLAYSREGEKCFNCGGKINKIKLSGRGTYYCPQCQK